MGTGFKGECACKGAEAWSYDCAELCENESGTAVQARTPVFRVLLGPQRLQLPSTRRARPLLAFLLTAPSALERDPVTGSGNPMSIKGGVSKLGERLELIHAPLTDGDRGLGVGLGACTEWEFGVPSPRLGSVSTWGGEVSSSPRRVLAAELQLVGGGDAG